MSILTHSPAIVRDGLVLCLDAGLNRSTNALADPGHPTRAGLYYGGPGVEDDYQPTGCKLITRADKTISQGTDLRAYDSNTQANWTGAVTGGGYQITKVSGSSSNGFYGYLNTSYGFTSNPVVGRRYRLLIRAKTNTGTIYLRFYDGAGSYIYFSTDVGTTLKTYTYDFTCLHGTDSYVYGTGSFADGETAYFDRYEVYELSPWLDVSGYNNHAEMVNAPTFSAESGAGGTRSFDFDGTGDYMQLDKSGTGDYTGALTVSAWFKADSSATGRLVAKDQASGGNPRWLFYKSGATLHFYFNDNANTVPDLTTTLTYGDWYHVAVTITSGSQKLYLNGAEEGSDTETTSNFTTDTNLWIGRYASASYWDGKIAIAHLYNRALTAAEIQQNYRTHKGRFGL